MARAGLPPATLLARSVLAFTLAGCASAPKPAPAPATEAPSAPRAPGTTAIAPGSAATETEKPAVTTSAVAPEPFAGGSIRAAPDKPPANETWGGMGLQEVNEKSWLAGVKQTVATQWKVETSALILSPGKLRVAFVRDPSAGAPPPAKPPKRPPRHPPPRRFQIIVVDNQGNKVAQLKPVIARGSDEPPKDLRFLAEDKLLYEVVSTPTAAIAAAAPSVTKSTTTVAKKDAARGKSKHAAPTTTPAHASAGRSAGKGPRPAGRTDGRRATTAAATASAPAPGPTPEKPPLLPPRLFVIQSLEPNARPIRCEGRHHTLTAQADHVAYVGGSPDAGFVAVDGTAVYPRRGRTALPGPVAWSKDGHSLAFIEARTGSAPKLVLLAEFDNPTGDTSWELPATTPVDGARVFWAGAGKLIVGKSLTHPIFSTSFEKQLPNGR